MTTANESPADLLASQLKNFLHAELPAAQDIEVVNIAPVSGGNARQAWSFDVQWNDQRTRRSVSCVMLRKAEAGQLETDIVPEFKAIASLWNSGVPVPRALWMDAEGRWLKRPAFIMEKAAGVSDIVALLKPEAAKENRPIAEHMAEVAATLHAVDWKARAIDFLPPATAEGAAAQQVEYWESLFLKNRMEPHPALACAFSWLKTHQPVAERIAIVHGDFRLGNFLYENNRITAMLDWEMVHLGDPIEDIAWAYRKLWSIGAMLELDDFVYRYTRISGIPVHPENLLFYRLFSEVKHSIISLTGARSFVDGRTRNLRMADRASTITGNLIQFFDWLPDQSPAE